jgi:two-component system response regulator (stage 0 sporulation protein A)
LQEKRGVERAFFMGNIINIIVVDDNIEIVNIIKEYSKTEKKFNLIATANNGIDAVEKIEKYHPDVVVLDIIIPKLDGIGVLEQIKKQDKFKNTVFIIFSAMGQDVFIKKSIALGADYYMMKPFDIETLFKRIEQFVQEKRHYVDCSQENVNKKNSVCELEHKICGLLHELEILPNMDGYLYLKEIVKYSIIEEKKYLVLKNELYPVVASKCNTTIRKVERAIRTCIDKAWLRISKDTIDELFGYAVVYTKERPTNAEFIGMLTEQIRKLY